MHKRLALSALMLVVLAACGGGAPGSTSNANPPAATGGGAATTKPGAAVDCAAIKTAAQELLAIQFLAQMKSPDAVESIKNKTIGNLDLDKFLAAMKTLHALDSFAGPLGDPKAALDFYEKAGTAALALFATDPITQAAIDTFNTENVGTVSDFLGHQIAIAGAMDEAGC